MTLADIYALVEMKADHARIERRNKALAGAIAQIAKGGSKSVASLGTVTLGGTPGTDVDWFVQTIRKADQAFSVMSNDFEFQVLALASLYFVIQQSETLRKQDNFPAALRAAAILSYGIHPQLELRKIHPGFKKAALSACMRAATLLESEARHVRARSGANVAKVDLSLPGATDPTFPEALKKVLKDMQVAFDQAIGAIQREGRADREEVDILWWLQTGFSKRIDKLLSGVDVNYVWVEIAEDAAALVNIPPALATIPVIETVIRRFVPKPEESLKASDLLDIRLESPVPASTAVNSYPMLFPSLMATEGKLDQSVWSGQTGLRNTTKLSITYWSLWHYKQRVLERMLNGVSNVR